MSKWERVEIRQKLQSLLEELLQSLSTRDEAEDVQKSVPVQPTLPEHWQRGQQQRNQAASGWYELKNKRPEGHYSQLLPHTDEAIREARRRLNISTQEDFERERIAKQETRITDAIKVQSARHTDATPALPNQTSGIPPITRKLEMDEPPHRRIEYATKSESLLKMMTGAVLYYACQYSPVGQEEPFVPPDIILMSPNNYLIVLPFVRHRPFYQDGYPLDKEGHLNIPYGVDASLDDSTIACVGH